MKRPGKSNRGFMLKNLKNGKYCRTFSHNAHTKDGGVQIYYEKTKGEKDWDLERGFIVNRRHLKFVGFID